MLMFCELFYVPWRRLGGHADSHIRTPQSDPIPATTAAFQTLALQAPASDRQQPGALNPYLSAGPQNYPPPSVPQYEHTDPEKFFASLEQPGGRVNLPSVQGYYVPQAADAYGIPTPVESHRTEQPSDPFSTESLKLPPILNPRFRDSQQDHPPAAEGNRPRAPRDPRDSEQKESKEGGRKRKKPEDKSPKQSQSSGDKKKSRHPHDPAHKGGDKGGGK